VHQECAKLTNFAKKTECLQQLALSLSAFGGQRKVRAAQDAALPKGSNLRGLDDKEENNRPSASVDGQG